MKIKSLLKKVTAMVLVGGISCVFSFNALAEQTNYKNLFLDFINKTNSDNEYVIQSIQISDLNLDGVPELICYDPGASASSGINIFQIINNKLELISGYYFNSPENSIIENDTFGRRFLDENLGHGFGLMGDSPSNISDYEDFEENVHTFYLTKNNNTGELRYILYGWSAASDFTDEPTYFFDNKDGILNLVEKMYKYDEYSEEEGVIINSTCTIDGSGVPRSEYMNAYSEFLNTWKKTNYKICCSKLYFWQDGYSEQKAKDLLDSYVPEMKQLNSACVFVNNQQVKFDSMPVIENGRTLVPVRAICEALGAQVNWDEQTQTITVAKGKTTLTLQLNSNILYKNGAKITLDVPAKIFYNRTLVPIRAISEGLGVQVNWDETVNKINLTD